MKNIFTYPTTNYTDASILLFFVNYYKIIYKSTHIKQ